MKLMVWNAARGGMRSAVEGYREAGLLDREAFRLVAAYADGSFWLRQLICLRALLVFTTLLCRHPIELVHIHTATRGSFWRKALFASIARLFRVPVILHLHGSEFLGFYQDRSAPVQCLIRHQLERATRVIVLSEIWRTELAAIAPTARLAVIPNTVALPPINAPSGTAPNILFLGRIGPRKGAFDLITAFAAIAPRYPALRLTLAGDGQTSEARAAAAALNLSHRITVLDWVDTPTRADLLAKATIFALPSHDEGLPMSVLEAMAAGLPVVTTPVGGIPDLITSGQTGLLVPPGDPAALAKALAALLDDPAHRAQLGNAARRLIAQSYTPEIALPHLTALYAACARSPNPHPHALRATD